jgi:hypothetical protein
VYQPLATRRAVKGDWIIKGPRRAGFAIADYDPGQELVIDPIIFSTYLGGTSSDVNLSVALDGAGNIYLCGQTASADFPLQAPFDGTYNAGDLFVAKMNPAGTALLYSTYLGGSVADFRSNFGGQGIAVDSTGSACITGWAQIGDYPTVNAAQATFGGSGDAVVTKLNPAGNALVFSTFLGGPNPEVGYAIAVDATGAVYTVGECRAGFPTTAGGAAMPSSSSSIRRGRPSCLRRIWEAPVSTRRKESLSTARARSS